MMDSAVAAAAEDCPVHNDAHTNVVMNALSWQRQAA